MFRCLSSAVALVSAVSVYTGALSADAEERLIDGIAATVDREVILYSEVINDVRALLEDIQRDSSTLEEANRRTEEAILNALDERIETNILYREALLGGIQINQDRLDQLVESRISELRRDFDTSEEFVNALKDSGQTIDDLRARHRKVLVANAMRREKEREISEDIVIAEAEIREHYEEHPEEHQQPERVLFRQIYIPWDSPEEQARVRAQMELIQEELEAGADFGELAQAHSRLPGADTGGLMGWHPRGELIQDVEDVVFSLPEGGVSDIVETIGAFNLFKVEERQEAGRASLDDMRAQIEQELRRRATEERFEVWINELRRRSRVRTLL